MRISSWGLCLLARRKVGLFHQREPISLPKCFVFFIRKTGLDWREKGDLRVVFSVFSDLKMAFRGCAGGLFYTD